MQREIVIRAGQGTLAFLVTDAEGNNTFHPYAVKSGMSLSANLRQAFKEQPYLGGGAEKALLVVTSPVVLIPREDYIDTEEMDVETIYNSVLPGHRGEEKIVKEILEIEAVGIFATNRDLQLVVSDNCRNYSVQNVMIPVWRHLYRRYWQMGQHRRLFAYFHDKVMDVCCFDRHRLKFANVFDAAHGHDALYYLLFVWKQLGMNAQEDELLILGDTAHEEWLMNKLRSYVRNVALVNQDADLLRSPFASIKEMPFDMKL